MDKPSHNIREASVVPWLCHSPCKPGGAGSIQGFSSPLDGTINRGPISKVLPGVLGIQGEGPFIFRELGSTSKYFKGSGEQAKI